jgi:hypothetical protein
VDAFVSSRHSRRAASWIVSSHSKKPPGKFHEPMNGAIALRASRTRFRSADVTTLATVTTGFR